MKVIWHFSICNIDTNECMEYYDVLIGSPLAISFTRQTDQDTCNSASFVKCPVYGWNSISQSNSHQTLNANYIVHLMRKIQIHTIGEFIFVHVNGDVGCTPRHVGIGSMDLDIMTAIFHLLIRATDLVKVLPNGSIRIRIFKVVFSYMQYHSFWCMFAHFGWYMMGMVNQDEKWKGVSTLETYVCLHCKANCTKCSLVWKFLLLIWQNSEAVLDVSNSVNLSLNAWLHTLRPLWLVKQRLAKI